MPHPVKGLLKIYEDLSEILPVLQVFPAEDSEIIRYVVLDPVLTPAYI